MSVHVRLPSTGGSTYSEWYAYAVRASAGEAARRQPGPAKQAVAIDFLSAPFRQERPPSSLTQMAVECQLISLTYIQWGGRGEISISSKCDMRLGFASAVLRIPPSPGWNVRPPSVLR